MDALERATRTFEGLERPYYPRKRKVTTKLEKRFCDMFDRGMKKKDIARITGISDPVVSKYLIKNGRRTNKSRFIS